jgi:hypothetical protein
MHADFWMMPRESALFSRGCKLSFLGVSHVRSLRRLLRLRYHGLCPACRSRKVFGRMQLGPKPLILIRFHAVLFGNQHEIWSKQHNGKVSPMLSSRSRASRYGPRRTFRCVTLQLFMEWAFSYVRTLSLAQGSRRHILVRGCPRLVPSLPRISIE